MGLVIASSKRVRLRGAGVEADVAWTSLWREALSSGGVDLVCRSSPRSGGFLLECEGVTFVDVGQWVGIPSLLSLRRIVRAARAADGDCLIFRDAVGLAFACLRKRRAKGVTVMVLNGFGTAHITFRGRLHPFVLRASQWLMEFMTKCAARRADSIIVVSESLVDSLPKSNGNVLVAPEVDWEALESAVEVQTGFRDEEAVAFVARLEEEKGVRLAIRAVCAARRPRRLIVVGRGSLSSWVREELSLASSWLDAEVIDHLPHRDLLQLFASVGTVVVPSESEGFGLVALEAAVMGCAVVSSNVGGLPEAVGWAENALLLGTRDPATWADALDMACPRSVLTAEELVGLKARSNWYSAREALALSGIEPWPAPAAQRSGRE